MNYQFLGRNALLWVICALLLSPPTGFQLPSSLRVGMSQHEAYHCSSSTFSPLNHQTLSPSYSENSWGPLRAARAQLTVEEMPRAGARTGWRPPCHHSVSPFPLPWGFSCMWLGKSSPVISEDFRIKAWSSTMVALGEESWLTQWSPPTTNTHTDVHLLKLSEMF